MSYQVQNNQQNGNKTEVLTNYENLKDLDQIFQQIQNELNQLEYQEFKPKSQAEKKIQEIKDTIQDIIENLDQQIKNQYKQNNEYIKSDIRDKEKMQKKRLLVKYKNQIQQLNKQWTQTQKKYEMYLHEELDNQSQDDEEEDSLLDSQMQNVKYQSFAQSTKTKKKRMNAALKNMYQVSELYSEVSSLVNQQSEVIVQVENNTEKVYENAKEANKQLLQAKSKQDKKGSSRMTYLIILIIVFVVLFYFTLLSSSGHKQ